MFYNDLTNPMNRINEGARPELVKAPAALDAPQLELEERPMRSLAYLYLVAAIFAAAPAHSQTAYIQPVTCRAETTACMTANVAAVQGAINSFGPAQGGVVQITDGVPINQTIVVKNNVMVKGFGFGSSAMPSPSSYFKWFGPAGQPMFLFQTYFGGGMTNVRLIGNSSSRPSAAIQLDTDGERRNMFAGLFDQIWIGGMYGLDSDGTSPQFQDGILFTGTTNEDTHTFGLVIIASVKGSGINIQNPNAGVVTFENLSVKDGQNCIWSNGGLVIHTLFCATSGYNLMLASPGSTNIGTYVAERSGGLAKLVGGVGPNTGNYLQRLFIRDGSFQITSSVVNPILDVGNSVYWKIFFDAMNLPAISCGLPAPILRLANSGSGLVDGVYHGPITSPGCGVKASIANFITGKVDPAYAQQIFDYQVGGTGGPW